MTRTKIHLSLLATAACLTLGVAQAQTSTQNRGASPSTPGTMTRDAGTPASSSAPGTQAQDQDTSAKDLAPGSAVRNPAADQTNTKKKSSTGKKPDKMKPGDTSGSDSSTSTTQPTQ
jgi:hypothetical protein